VDCTPSSLDVKVKREQDLLSLDQETVEVCEGCVMVP
jgi:hypothetical protein